jgi:hypothetical protein
MLRGAAIVQFCGNLALQRGSVRARVQICGCHLFLVCEIAAEIDANR